MSAEALAITSTTFADGGPLPTAAAHPSVGGANRSPHLAWSGAPDGTRSFAVACWDPDAPTTVGFCHLILANLPPDRTELPEGELGGDRAPSGAAFGLCDWGTVGYGGMGPPPGDDPHHYQWTIYALGADRVEVDDRTTYAKFRFLIRSHVLASACRTGRFGLPAE